MSRNDQLNITDEAALLWLEANRFDAANVCARRKLSRLSTSHAEQPFPLLLACESGNVPLCQWLLDHGAAPTLSTVSNHRWTPMSKYPISPSCYFEHPNLRPHIAVLHGEPSFSASSEPRPHSCLCMANAEWRVARRCRWRGKRWVHVPSLGSPRGLDRNVPLDHAQWRGCFGPSSKSRGVDATSNCSPARARGPLPVANWQRCCGL